VGFLLVIIFTLRIVENHRHLSRIQTEVDDGTSEARVPRAVLVKEIHRDLLCLIPIQCLSSRDNTRACLIPPELVLILWLESYDRSYPNGLPFLALLDIPD
jgi:hypothetical protein